MINKKANLLGLICVCTISTYNRHKKGDIKKALAIQPSTLKKKWCNNY